MPKARRKEWVWRGGVGAGRWWVLLGSPPKGEANCGHTTDTTKNNLISIHSLYATLRNKRHRWKYTP